MTPNPSTQIAEATKRGCKTGRVQRIGAREARPLAREARPPPSGAREARSADPSERAKRAPPPAARRRPSYRHAETRLRPDCGRLGGGRLELSADETDLVVTAA